MSSALSTRPLQSLIGGPIFSDANRARSGAASGSTVGDSADLLSVGAPQVAECVADANVDLARGQGTTTEISDNRLGPSAARVFHLGPDRLREPGSAVAERYLRVPQASAQPYAFDLRQQWEGVVARIDQDEFTIVLRDTTNAKAPEYEAVLAKEEVPDEDLGLLRLGAILYWTIGYETTRTGQRKRVSSVRLRRLPAWTRRDLARIQERAQELEDLLPKAP